MFFSSEFDLSRSWSLSEIVRLKTSLSYAAFGQSQDGSSLLRSALANERGRTHWGKRSLVLPLLPLLIILSALFSSHQLPVRLLVRRFGCSFLEFHSFAHVSLSSVFPPSSSHGIITA